MKLVKLLLGIVLLIFIGGFVYFALTDVPVTQQDLSKEIPHERLAQP